MPVIERVKWDGSPNLLAWKFPSDELATWTQLIVNESQEAFVVHGGVYDGPFGAGRHTLSTENIPLLRKAIKLPFGGRTPFTAEVWFVNKVTNLDIRWGTPDPIQLEDPKFHVMVPVRAFGQYGLRIADSKRFLLKLVGTLKGFDTEILSEYFRGVLITRLKTEIAKAIVTSGVSILEVNTRLETLSEELKQALAPQLAEYGVGLSQFNIHSINVPDDDPAVQALKAALAKRATMGIIGFNYQQERSFDVMEAAASNEGNSGNVMGAGIGFGIGAGVGVPIGQAFGQASKQLQPGGTVSPETKTDTPAASTTRSALTPAERIQALKDLAELKNQGVLNDDEFNAEKRRILGM